MALLEHRTPAEGSCNAPARIEALGVHLAGARAVTALACGVNDERFLDALERQVDGLRPRDRVAMVLDGANVSKPRRGVNDGGRTFALTNLNARSGGRSSSSIGL